MMRPPTPEEQVLLRRAMSLHQQGHVHQARPVYRQVLAGRPDDPDLLRLLGAAEIQLGDHAEAVELLSRSLALWPQQPGVLYNRASALQALGRLEEAIESYDAALQIKPDYADAYNNRGNALLALRRYDEALASFDRALAVQPEVPSFYANRAIALNGLEKLEAAAACYRKALALEPRFASAHADLARIYERQGHHDRAVVQWSRMAEAFSDSNEGSDLAYRIAALNNMARILADNLRDDVGAETVARQSLRLDPLQEEPAQDIINARQRRCAWPIVEPFDNVSRENILRGMSPLATCVYTDDPMLQLAANWRRCPPLKEGRGPAHRPFQALKSERLRIGYLSSDLREHPIGQLMYEIPTLHDGGRVEAFAYYCGPQAQDAVHQHYRSAFEHFVDLTGMSDDEAARRIADDGVQILVDINGHTLHNRKRLLARQPAPVIVNWLGFPGSMGSEYHQYIIADDWTLPPEHEIYFSEQPMRLPCYQPNNRQRLVSDRAPTRAAAGLPQDAFVFCCFNDTKKINRHTFDRWLTILERTPRSVLWLLSATSGARDNLRAHAGRRGIDPARIVFADWKSNPEHLARYRLADLFLDTTPYGAHTTCSDALWMGVPVITLSGRSFASRVGGSLLRQAGLAELVFTDAEAFVDEAVALAADKGRLAAYRERLRTVRQDSVLFDTPALVRALESLYEQMWEACVQERLPRPDLSNMAHYLAVGFQHDHEAVEVQAIADYEGWWRRRMAEWSEREPVTRDNRLSSQL